MYVPSCHTKRSRITAAGINPSSGSNDGMKIVTTNMMTLAPMSAFSAVERGPGPKENDETYGEG